MNFILCLLIAAYFCILEVNCRSVQVDNDARSVLDVIADKDGNHDTESGGIFSWIRLKPLLRREVQRIGNVKDEANKINSEPAEPLSSESSKQDQNLSENVDEHKNEDTFLKAESQITDTSTSKSELTEHFDQHEDQSTESNLSDFTYNTTDVEIHHTNHPLVARDFPDNILSDILNQTSDSIFLPALNDNSSSDFDETSVLSEGGLIATVQEVSTVGFELLIDSETKQNSILAELINSQSNLIDDDDDLNNSTDEDDINFVTIKFNPSKESELEETERNTEPTDNPDASCCADEVETENVEPDPEEDKTEFDSNEDNIVQTELSTDKVENSESVVEDDETENNEFDIGEIENVNNELEFSDSDQNSTVNDIVTTEPEDPNCPDPGWCIFWFMALDLCATNSHCHGSLICCTIGCSKTCIDPNDELLF